eukprot:Nitzschia sp. Nitz4//scaffold166_size90379//17632//20571//NITZ4_005049-RA/size90379-processed-gene-0.40-mRNA-1//1//CDS//3329538172//4530//frame0
MRGAKSELGLSQDSDASPMDLLIGYLQRLNPSVEVETVSRDDLTDRASSQTTETMLCIDRPYDTQVYLNSICREASIPFVSVETAGVYGRVFSDFGPTFTVYDTDGETPLTIPFGRIEVLDCEQGTLRLHTMEGERHDVSRGDRIQFFLSTGACLDMSCRVVKVETPHRVIVERLSKPVELEEFASKVNTETSTFSRVKEPVNQSFLSLSDATALASDPSIFTTCDLDKSHDPVRRTGIFGLFQSLNMFVREHERIPKMSDATTLKKMCESEFSGLVGRQGWKHHYRSFARTCAAKFVPLQAVFGAISAQECIKAITGCYNPIQQFLLSDCDEVLDDSTTHLKLAKAKSGQAYILGKGIDKAMRNNKVFVIGSGAIGCELLKNVAAMGVGTASNGRLFLTDMDTIEQSNLSRQLLFRDGDISKFKSKAAEEAVLRLNPKVKIESHTAMIGDYDGCPFGSPFWSGVDIVMNALDNIEARLHVDSRCVEFRKALVDAGTLGSKGNVQVVVPMQSESYASSADPPEPAIPVCTVKNFPYAISHTIQWGRNLFDGLFIRRPKQVNQYLESMLGGKAQNLMIDLELKHGREVAQTIAAELVEDLRVQPPSDMRAEAVRWAADLVSHHFRDAIEALLLEHPKDSLDDDGEPFWSGSRKAPTPLSFSAIQTGTLSQGLINQYMIDFVQSAARLRLESFLGCSNAMTITKEEAIGALLQVKSVVPATDVSDQVLREVVYNRSSQPRSRFVQSFEKDDESNDHIRFIAAASNLRALCYGIPPVDTMETRRIAGRIIPAMITTTAFVSALSCVELVKLVQGASLERHRNAFINLALPFFAFTMPVPAEEIEGLNGTTYTLWDRIVIDATASGDLTLRQFLSRILDEIGNPDIEVASISFGPYLIYASFLWEEDDERLDHSLMSIVEEAVAEGADFDLASSREIEQQANKPSPPCIEEREMELSVVVADVNTGEEAEIPPVKVVRNTATI